MINCPAIAMARRQRVMDNVSLHHSDRIEEMCVDAE